MNVLTYYFSQLNNPVDSDKFPSFIGTSQDSQDSNKSPIFEMPPLGREPFTPLVKDKGEQSEEKSLSLDRLPLSPLNDKIFQIAENRSQGLLIKLQQYFFNNKVTIPGLSFHITGRYLGNPQNLLIQFIQVGINLDICPNPLPIPIESRTPITVELLLNYGMISQIWFSDKAKLTNFPY